MSQDLLAGWESQLIALAQVTYAGFLGALLGVEREIHDKPAGLRTHTLVAASGCLLMILGISIVDVFDAPGDNTELIADPIRTLQAIVMGISFLGAGTIIHEGREKVEGLTTAASVFLAVSIGIGVAAQQYILVTAVTVLTLIVMRGLGFFSHRLGHDDRDR